MRSIVLLSGGLDSTTLLAHVLDAGGDPLAVSFDYGQKHRIELAQAASIAKYYDVEHVIQAIPPGLFRGAGSALIDGAMPHLTYEELDQAEGPSQTYVPNRNAILINLAVALALTRDAGEVYCAPHAEDARNWAYPDCSPEFNGAMAAAVYIATYRKVRLLTPFQWMRKAEIVILASHLLVPFSRTHSCYEGTRPACGVCPTCMARIQAFAAAGVDDSIEYAAVPA